MVHPWLYSAAEVMSERNAAKPQTPRRQRHPDTELTAGQLRVLSPQTQRPSHCAAAPCVPAAPTYPSSSSGLDHRKCRSKMRGGGICGLVLVFRFLSGFLYTGLYTSSKKKILTFLLVFKFGESIFLPTYT